MGRRKTPPQVPHGTLLVGLLRASSVITAMATNPSPSPSAPAGAAPAAGEEGSFWLFACCLDKSVRRYRVMTEQHRATARAVLAAAQQKSDAAAAAAAGGGGGNPRAPRASYTSGSAQHGPGPELVISAPQNFQVSPRLGLGGRRSAIALQELVGCALTHALCPNALMQIPDTERAQELTSAACHASLSMGPTGGRHLAVSTLCGTTYVFAVPDLVQVRAELGFARTLFWAGDGPKRMAVHAGTRNTCGARCCWCRARCLKHAGGQVGHARAAARRRDVRRRAARHLCAAQPRHAAARAAAR